MILKIVFSISIVIFLSFAVTSYSGYENELFGVNTVLKSVMEYPLPEIIDVSFPSFPFISHTSAGFFLILMRTSAIDERKQLNKQMNKGKKSLSTSEKR
ncbi:uncharacterized protein LOC144650004 isoform X4 [Oculina patagonica]